MNRMSTTTIIGYFGTAYFAEFDRLRSVYAKRWDWPIEEDEEKAAE